MGERSKAVLVLTMNTVAFTVCFACWMLNGVLATFLVDNGLFDWNKARIGWLIGIPVLTGSIMRLPIGLLTDRYGGRKVYTLLMLLAAIPMWLLSYATTFQQFALASLGFGLTGASFAVGIAYTAAWFRKERQGLAFGIFGAGNIGAALTTLVAPTVLKALTSGEAGLEGWRMLPRALAALLALTATAFHVLTFERRIEGGARGLLQRLAPLRELRVWRFGLYYFFVFGGFVALSQWLVGYYLNVYAMSLTTAGLMASCFSLPSGAVRPLGGFISDRIGARTALYLVLSTALAACLLLIVPRMEIEAPGEGLMAPAPGVVTGVSETEIALGKDLLPIRPRPAAPARLEHDPSVLVLPRFESWQEPVVSVGQHVKRKEVLARGITHISFQANVWIFSGLVFLLATAMGVGMAAVYKHIPNYFPRDVGLVGGLVGVIGGLGGFFLPIVFGLLLQATGVWTSCWMLLLLVASVCLVWMHLVVRRIVQASAPHVAQRIDHLDQGPPPPGAAVKAPQRSESPRPAPAPAVAAASPRGESR